MDDMCYNKNPTQHAIRDCCWVHENIETLSRLACFAVHAVFRRLTAN